VPAGALQGAPELGRAGAAGPSRPALGARRGSPPLCPSPDSLPRLPHFMRRSVNAVAIIIAWATRGYHQRTLPTGQNVACKNSGTT